MDNQEYVYTEQAPDPAELELNIEKKDLRKRCNSVGLITIIASAVFMTVSTILVFIQLFAEEISSAVLPEFVDSIPDNLLNGFANVLGIGILGFIFLKSRYKFTNEPLPFAKIGKKTLVCLVCIGFTVCMISNFMTNVYMSTLYSLGIDINLEYETAITNSPLEIMVELVATALVPAFSEEILFRGILLSTLRKYGDGFAVFVSSFIFGLFHGNLIQFPFAFIVGMVLGWTLVYTNSMLPAILIHCFNNAFSVVLDVIYTNSVDWGISEAVVDVTTSIVVGILAIISVVFAYKLSKKDKGFLKLQRYEGILDNKTKTKTLLTSPTIIISCVLLVQETIMTHLITI